MFTGNDSNKIHQIGNAIPPMLARIFAEHIKKDYGFDSVERPSGKLLGYLLTKAGAMSPALKKADSLLYSIYEESFIKQGKLFEY